MQYKEFIYFDILCSVYKVCCKNKYFYLLKNKKQLNNKKFLIFLKKNFSLSSSISPCSYPHFSDRLQCGIHDSNLLNGWICDPDNTISMSEGITISQET